MPLKSMKDCCMASRCEKKIILKIPGINHSNTDDKAVPAFNSALIHPEKNTITIINTRLTIKFIIKDEDAITTFSSSMFELLTYRTCAFFSKPLLVASKMEVNVRNNAQIPISVCENTRTRIIKFINPKKVSENRCRIV